jgi:beta-lactamase superfamily II metal-dependent hydrolase
MNCTAHVLGRRALALSAILLIGAWRLWGQDLQIRFLDVGQGDAALITAPEGKKVLIDAGRGSWPVVAYLRASHYDTLDLVIASHNHADHIGGMADVLATTVVRYYLDNGIPHTTATYQRTIQAVEASGAQYLNATARTITVGSARLRVLAPPPEQVDQNNGSVGILVEYGQFRALLTGDSEQYELEYWLEHDSIPQVQVLKVAHHGSWNGTTEAWATRTRPQVAVISVGANNQYRHPAAEVVGLWTSVGARVYRTDRDGTVAIDARRDGTFTVTTGAPINPFDSVAVLPPPKSVDSSRLPGAEAPMPSCCRICTRGKACGNTCISRSYECHTPPGCACDARR